MNEDKKRISEFIDTLRQFNFAQTVDKAGDCLPDSDLYYRKTSGGRFLVFNHYNKKHRAEFQGFDCWLSTYGPADEVGLKKAQKIETVQLGFQIERDWPLIEQYL